jgi:hypothetical protein
MLIESVKFEIRDVGHPNVLTLEKTAKNTWAIRDGRACMSKTLSPTFTYEPGPSHRTEDFLRDHRFTFEEAITVLKKLQEKNAIHRQHTSMGDSGRQCCSSNEGNV